jgi:hypothetical protein
MKVHPELGNQATQMGVYRINCPCLSKHSKFVTFCKPLKAETSCGNCMKQGPCAV